MYLENNFKKQFSKAIDILEILEEAGYQAYFVGGCVRDYLMNNEFADIDITTSATPEQVKNLFQKTFDTGLQHGTVTVLYDKIPYEITTFRSESNYINHRSPKNVEFITTLEGDLERRDFTINALTLDKNGKVTDLHNGLLDIENKIIRTVNEPNERFSEDALRMLRAFRFASKLNFTIDKQTLQAIVDNAKLIEYISIERIVAELRKLFVGENNTYAIQQLQETNIHSYMPFLKHIRKYTDQANFTFTQSLFYLADINEIPLEEIRKLKLSNKELSEIKEYIIIKTMFENNITLQEIIYKNERSKVNFVNNIYKFVQCEELDNISLPIMNFSEIDINVQAIIAIFPERKVGPWIKEIIHEIENAIIHEKLENKKENIIEFINNRNN